jgi:hypothetical protein
MSIVLLLRCELRGPLRALCEQWLAGDDLFAVERAPLARFIGALRLIPTSERPIESQHAKTHKRGLGRHYHTEQFISFGLRVPEINERLDSAPGTLQSLAFFCQTASSAKDACRALGLSAHPAITQEYLVRNMFRHPIFAKVIYHGDPWTLYSAAPPPLDFDDDSDGPGDLDDGRGFGGAAHPLDGAPIDGALAPDGAGGASSQNVESASAAGGGCGHVQRGAAGGPSGAAGGDSSGGSGGGSGSGPSKSRLIMTLHHGAVELLHKYLVQYIQLRIVEYKGSYFSVPLHPQALATVKARMQPHLQVPGDLGEDISLATSSMHGLKIKADVV